ncbi:MAG: hypothetical protein ACRDIU_08545, partial [Actinomycetota bacterium]
PPYQDIFVTEMAFPQPVSRGLPVWPLATAALLVLLGAALALGIRKRSRGREIPELAPGAGTNVADTEDAGQLLGKRSRVRKGPELAPGGATSIAGADDTERLPGEPETADRHKGNEMPAAATEERDL